MVLHGVAWCCVVLRRVAWCSMLAPVYALYHLCIANAAYQLSLFISTHALTSPDAVCDDELYNVVMHFHITASHSAL